MTKTLHAGTISTRARSSKRGFLVSGKYKEKLRAQREKQLSFTPRDLPQKNLHNRELGEAGENLAVGFLESQKYRVIDRNWRCKAGEVDIVALSPERRLSFVEVKTRSSHRYGTPAEAITYSKLSRMRRVMGAWFETHEAPAHYGTSLDLVGVDWNGEGNPVITHRKGLK